VAKKADKADGVPKTALENEKTIDIRIRKWSGRMPRDGTPKNSQILNGYTIEINGSAPALLLTTHIGKQKADQFDQDKQWKYFEGYAEEAVMLALLRLFKESEIAGTDTDTLRDENSDLMKFVDDNRKYVDTSALVPGKRNGFRLTADLVFGAIQASSRLQGRETPSLTRKPSAIRFSRWQLTQFYQIYESIYDVWVTARRNCSRKIKNWKETAIEEFKDQMIEESGLDKLFKLLIEKKPGTPLEYRWEPFQIALVHAAREAGQPDCSIKQWATLNRIYGDLKKFHNSLGAWVTDHEHFL
jgi:hypothetical protein